MSEVVAENMVSIEIDGIEMQAPKGSMIIEAADRQGITIPRFCYHHKLSIAANCRMCLVDVEKAPKPLPACATPVMDGMKVYTRSKRAMSAQRNVMELLLINHPLDCPICDQGGECELQDVSMGYGRSVSRFEERKRVVKDENLGALISTEMTRCIHCTRCVRFLEEIAGTSELGGIGRGDRTTISTFIGRSIDSELSGNIIDLCPVGALTNKPFRFRARAWELRASASIAPHDCVGSNIHYHTRRGRILRAVPRDNEALNESWLSDRDRWGFEGLYADDRATAPLVRNESGELGEADLTDALSAAAAILRESGAEGGYLIGGQSTSEEMFLAQRVARALGSENVDSRLRLRDCSGDTTPQFPITLADLAAADTIVLVGANVSQDYPIIGHRVRQAQRNGAQILSLAAYAYPGHIDVDQQWLARPSTWIEALAEDGDIARRLGDSERAVILLGQGAQTHGAYGNLRKAAAKLAESHGAALCVPGIDANAHGAAEAGALPGDGGRNALSMAQDRLPAYLIYNFEADRDTAFSAALMAALQEARVVIVASHVSAEMAAVADVVLPLAPAPEAGGSMVALNGARQSFATTGTPPGDARAGWKLLRVLGNLLEIDGFDYTRVEQVTAELADCEPRQTVASPAPEGATSEGFEACYETAIYNIDALVRRSPGLQGSNHARGAEVRIHPEAGVSAETIRFGGGDWTVVSDQRVAAGVAVFSAGTQAADLTSNTVEFG